MKMCQLPFGRACALPFSEGNGFVGDTLISGLSVKRKKQNKKKAKTNSKQHKETSLSVFLLIKRNHEEIVPPADLI